MEDCIELFGCFIPESLFLCLLLAAVVFCLGLVVGIAKATKAYKAATYDPYSF